MDPLVIKLGGKLLENQRVLGDLFSVLYEYQKYTPRPIIILHGGGCMVDKVMQRFQLPVMKLGGQRITPLDQIEIIVGTLAGIVNKRLMAIAKQYGLVPVGLCLSDGNSTKIEQLEAKLGCVGKASKGLPTFLQQCLNGGCLPIISSIGISEDGQLFNVNADNAASAIAATLEAELLLLSDVPGVLDENARLLPILNSKRANDLIHAGIIKAGMIVKVKEALKIAKMLKRAVNIAGIQSPEQLIALLNGKGMATQIRY